jgi:outer membrane lipoprotein-sorting protein
MKQFTFLKSVLLMALLFVAGSVGAKDVATLKALLQDASTTETYTLTNPVTVVYQNGKYLYVKDASASALVYGTMST